MRTSTANGRAGRSHRRRVASGAVALVLAASFGLVSTPAAQAVHDAGAMQLDGNAQTAVQSTPNAPDDWDRVCFEAQFNVTTNPTPACGTTTPTSGATAVAFANDGAQSATIFTTGGSKDPENISSWRWKNGGGLPDKDNLQDAFAARYSLAPSTTCPAGNNASCELLYFGSDRVDNSGDAVLGFWFFQNKIGLNANGTFSGVHKVGDLLVLSDFSNGGDVSTINVYRWVGSGGDTNGSLDFLAGGAASKCGGATADAFCGIVNPTNGTPSPWPFTDKSGNDSFLNGEFYEGGINLSDPAINLAGSCFSSVASESRASTSPSATLKDFVLGSFGDCTSTTVTTPKLADGSTDIPAAGVSIGTGGSVQVKDRAVVSAKGGASLTPGGDVTFALCGPTPLTDAAYTLCTTGGTTIGSPVALSGTANPATVTSAAATVTSAGRYCWRAVYSGDTVKGVPGSSDARESECFKVLPVTPTLTTLAGAGPVTLGSPVTDTATLSGTAPKPGTPAINPTTAGASAGGTITFMLYGPDTCSTLAAGFPSDGISRAVSGNGGYPTGSQAAVSFTPTAVGTYHWVASYSGDAPNTLGDTHNTLCDDTFEDVTVQQLVPSISTAQSFVPNDSATLTVVSGGGALAGNVVFKLFDNATCSGTALYDSGNVALVADLGGLSGTASSNNTTAYGTNKSFSWLVTYTSTNGGHTGATSVCNDENSSITINNNYIP